MSVAKPFEPKPLFLWSRTQVEQPIGIISIPHSGEFIPEEFREYLTEDVQARQADLDYRVYELIDIPALNEAGISVVRANLHRICVDLNRAPDESVLFWKENTHGNQLLMRDPAPDLLPEWVKRYHTPYFEGLTEAIRGIEKAKSGRVPFVDLHSMPSKPTAYHYRRNPNQTEKREDFCLSDRNGRTCAPEFIQAFSEALKVEYTVAINDPYIGGYITQFVDGFRTNNIQIEINRSIYMDEATGSLTPDLVARLKPVLTYALIRVFQRFSS